MAGSRRGGCLTGTIRLKRRRIDRGATARGSRGRRARLACLPAFVTVAPTIDSAVSPMHPLRKNVHSSKRRRRMTTGARAAETGGKQCESRKYRRDPFRGDWAAASDTASTYVLYRVAVSHGYVVWSRVVSAGLLRRCTVEWREVGVRSVRRAVSCRWSGKCQVARCGIGRNVRHGGGGFHAVGVTVPL